MMQAWKQAFPKSNIQLVNTQHSEKGLKTKTNGDHLYHKLEVSFLLHTHFLQQTLRRCALYNISLILQVPTLDQPGRPYLQTIDIRVPAASLPLIIEIPSLRQIRHRLTLPIVPKALFHPSWSPLWSAYQKEIPMKLSKQLCKVVCLIHWTTISQSLPYSFDRMAIIRLPQNEVVPLVRRKLLPNPSTKAINRLAKTLILIATSQHAYHAENDVAKAPWTSSIGAPPVERALAKSSTGRGTRRLFKNVRRGTYVNYATKHSSSRRISRSIIKIATGVQGVKSFATVKKRDRY
jgi:hypothetical protein